MGKKEQPQQTYLWMQKAAADKWLPLSSTLDDVDGNDWGHSDGYHMTDHDVLINHDPTHGKNYYICLMVELDQKIIYYVYSMLSPMLFNIIMSYLQKFFGSETEISLLFADDVVLGSTDIVTLQNALSKWDKILKDHGLKISVKKTEFLPCQFSDP